MRFETIYSSRSGPPEEYSAVFGRVSQRFVQRLRSGIEAYCGLTPERIIELAATTETMDDPAWLLCLWQTDEIEKGRAALHSDTAGRALRDHVAVYAHEQVRGEDAGAVHRETIELIRSTGTDVQRLIARLTGATPPTSDVWGIILNAVPEPPCSTPTTTP